MEIHNLERLVSAQAAVVGSLLIDPSLCGEVFSRVRETDFVTPEYAVAFAAAKRLFFSSREVNAVTVCHEAGGGAYRDLLMQIMDVTPSAAGWESFVEVLLEQSKLHRLHELADRLARAATLEEGRGLLNDAQEIVNRSPRTRFVDMRQGLMDFLSSLDRPPDSLSTGIGRLDRLLYIEPGDLIVLGGRPSAGKTALALQIAWHMSRSRRVGFFSLETSDRKLFARLFAQSALMDFGALKRGAARPEDVARLTEQKDELIRRRLEIVPASGMTAADLQAAALARQYEVIFVDYLQLIRTVGRPGNRTEAVSQISMDLHTLAQRHGVTIMALSQLGRPEKAGDEQRAPTLTSLRESGQIEQDADAVLLLYLTSPLDPRSSARRLKVAKNKEGALGHFDLDFDGARQQFCEIMPDAPERAKIPYYRAKRPDKPIQTALEQALPRRQDR